MSNQQTVAIVTGVSQGIGAGLTHRDLMAWIDEPFAAPPDPEESPQGAMAFA
jgi:hypothetical protein